MARRRPPQSSYPQCSWQPSRTGSDRPITPSLSSRDHQVILKIRVAERRPDGSRGFQPTVLRTDGMRRVATPERHNMPAHQSSLRDGIAPSHLTVD